MGRAAHAFESAPPDGFSISEQSVESPFWRVQLDLATGGVRSLLRRTPVKLELADPEREPHLFQARVRSGGVPVLSRFIRSQVRFDARGARLTVESALAAGVWRTEFGVESGEAALRVQAGWRGPAPAEPVDVVLPFALDGWERMTETAYARALPDGRLVVEAEEGVWKDGPAAVSPSHSGTLSLRITAA